MNCLTHWPTFVIKLCLAYSKLLTLGPYEGGGGNLQAISAFVCGSGHVIPKHVCN